MRGNKEEKYVAPSCHSYLSSIKERVREASQEYCESRWNCCGKEDEE
jgi:hypothetical protein